MASASASGSAPRADARRQRLAREQLHDHERLTLPVAQVEHLADGGCEDPRGHACFPHQPCPRAGVGRSVRMQLERHAPPQALVFSGVHHPHAAFAQALEDAVRADLRGRVTRDVGRDRVGDRCCRLPRRALDSARLTLSGARSGRQVRARNCTGSGSRP